MSEVTTVESGVASHHRALRQDRRVSSPKLTLAILPGAKIEAEGEPNQPIVFTSAQPPGQRAPQDDWGRPS